MEKYKIDNAVGDLIPIFVESGYTEKTITELRRNIQKVVDLHQKSGKELYNAEIVMAYIFGLKAKYASGLVSRSRKKCAYKGCTICSCDSHNWKDFAGSQGGRKQTADILQ